MTAEMRAFGAAISAVRAPVSSILGTVLLIAVLSFSWAAAFLYVSQELGLVAAVGGGLLLSYPFAWLVARRERKRRARVG